MPPARTGNGFEQMLKLSDSWKFYTDYKGEWRWERISSDGGVVATKPKPSAKLTLVPKDGADSALPACRAFLDAVLAVLGSASPAGSGVRGGVSKLNQRISASMVDDHEEQQITAFDR